MSIVPTPEQQAVIDYPLLPLRVAAGAGTGKTTTMALRLAHLIKRESIAPEAALGITFTNKAAAELADRIRKELPHLAQEGRVVEVATYHGFAFAILQEFGAGVGVERQAPIITPGYSRQLFLDALGQGSYRALDLSAPGARVDDLVTLAGQLGDHLRLPGALVAHAPPEAERDEVWERRLEMAAALDRYRAIKRRLGAVDYSDLILAANSLLDGRPELAEHLQSRYRIVLLDEYQDTNPAQRLLLRKIFAGGFPLTAVGDPDQTIYEWRGASLENFAGFPEHFPDADGAPAETLRLTLNRRSDRRILDLANLVRSRIDTGAGDSGADLQPRPEAGEGSVSVGWFRTSVDEALRIAEEIRLLHDEEGMEWRDIAVLFRKNRQIGLVRDALELESIPVEVASLGGLLGVPEVVDLYAWLRLLGNAGDAPALVRVLLGARFRLGMADLAPLTAWVEARQPRGREDDPLRWTFVEAIEHLDDLSGLSDEARRRLEEFLELYRELLQDAQVTSLVELCRRILDRTGAWPEVETMDDASRLSARLNLYRFLDLAEEWSPLEGRPSLAAFLDYLTLLQEDETAEELDTARLGGEDAVALLTVHRAKGLEWPVVFLPALCEGTFPARTRRRDDPSQFAQLVPFKLRIDGERLGDLPAKKTERNEILTRRHLAQEWRTAYVAVTRAQRRLFCTGAFWYSERRPKKESDLFATARALPGVHVLGQTDEPGSPPEVLRLESLTEGAPDPHFDTDWKAALRAAADDPEWPEHRAGERDVTAPYHGHVEQLEIMLDGLPEPLPAPESDDRIATSVSGLVTYAACPLRYRGRVVAGLPGPPCAARRRGVDVHRRIELHNRGALAFEEADEAFYDLVPEDAGPPGRDPFATYRESRFARERPRFTEAPFDLKVGDGRVRGRIDAIYEPAPGHWEIVDFKTGTPRRDPSRRVQLQAYAVAVTDANFAPEPPDAVTVTFAYLGDGLQEESEQVDDRWLATARDRLTELMAGVEAKEFNATPSDACRICDFLRFCDAGRDWVEQQK